MLLKKANKRQKIAAYLVCIVKLNAALLRLAEYINRQGHLALQVTPSLSL